MTMPFLDPRLLRELQMRQMAGAQGIPAPRIDPRFQGAPQGAPQQAPPGASRSILDRVFGAPGASGLVDPDVIRQARSQALLNAGLSLLASGAPQRQRPSLGEGLQGAVQAGQGAYRQTISESIQAEQMRQQQEMEQEVGKIRQRYAGLAPDRQTMGNMAMEIAAARGDLGPMAALLSATQPEPMTAPKLHFEFDQETGKMGAYDQTTGQLVRATLMRPDGSMQKLNDDQVQWLGQIEGDLRQETRDSLDQAQSLGRFLGSVTQLQDALDAGTPEEAAWAVHALTMSFGKISDPGSVVREFEAAGIKDAGNVLQRVETFLARWKDGSITQQMLNSVTKNVALQVEGQKRVYDQQVDAARRRARVRGLQPEWVTVPQIYGGFASDLERAKAGWKPAAPRAQGIIPGLAPRQPGQQWWEKP